MAPTPEVHPVARRKLLLASAWAVPVIAVASATPAFASSDEKRVDLSSQAKVPNENPSSVNDNGLSVWRGPRTLTFDFTYANSGPDALPAGATVSVGLPFASIWETNTMKATLSGSPLTLLTTSTESIGGQGEPEAYRRWWHFYLPFGLAPGQSVTVKYSVYLTGVSNAASKHYRVRCLGRLGGLIRSHRDQPGQQPGLLQLHPVQPVADRRSGGTKVSSTCGSSRPHGVIASRRTLSAGAPCRCS